MSTLVDLTDDDDDIQIISVAAAAAPPQPDLVEITVIEACSAKKEVVRCAPASTVRQLKRLVEDKFDRPTDSQRLIWQGQELKPFTKALKQFGFKSVGNMIVHLAGVKPTPVIAAAVATKKKKVLKAVGKRKTKASSVNDSDGVSSSNSGSGRVKRQKRGEVGQSSTGRHSSTGSSTAVSPEPRPGPGPGATASSGAATRRSRPTEKRLKRLRILTQKLRERQQRALAQRMFLVSRKLISDDAESLVGLAEEFLVLGSTGNVYTVVINRQPHCTCPDHAKGNVCKHIIFVMLRVLGISRDSNLWYQAALLQDELASVFANAPQHQARTVMASSIVLRALAGEEEVEEDENDESGRKPYNGEDCAICFEEMSTNEELVWDRDSCGKSIHRACFKMWAAHSTSPREDPVCPSCRGVWHRDPPTGGVAATATAAAGVHGVREREGYMNVADLQGMSSERPAYSSSDWRRRNSRW